MLYAYRAVDAAGQTLSAEREATSERELADLLRREGYLLLDTETPQARARRALRLPALFAKIFGRVSLVERMVFSRNLAVMVAAGLPVTRALEALAEQSSNRRFRAIIQAIRQAIVNGKTLAEGLRPFEHIFGTLFLNMIESGEISGNLVKVLTILARQMKRDHDLRSKVRGALMYPTIVVGALVLIGILMMVYVVPTLTTTFTELGVNLPLTTRIVIAASGFLLHEYLYLLAALFIAAIALLQFRRSSAGHRLMSSIALKMPVFGALVQKLNSARFARTLASLVSSGIPITRALEVTSGVLGNVHFRDTLADAAVVIQRGEPLSTILKQHPELFPPMVTEMVQVGEETGTISTMLLRLALFYEEEVTMTTKNLSSIIEPVLMIVIGAVVGFFAISMIQPIYGGLGNL